MPNPKQTSTLTVRWLGKFGDSKTEQHRTVELFDTQDGLPRCQSLVYPRYDNRTGELMNTLRAARQCRGTDLLSDTPDDHETCQWHGVGLRCQYHQKPPQDFKLRKPADPNRKNGPVTTRREPVQGVVIDKPTASSTDAKLDAVLDAVASLSQTMAVMANIMMGQVQPPAQLEPPKPPRATRSDAGKPRQSSRGQAREVEL